MPMASIKFTTSSTLSDVMEKPNLNGNCAKQWKWWVNTLIPSNDGCLDSRESDEENQLRAQCSKIHPETFA